MSLRLQSDTVGKTLKFRAQTADKAFQPLRRRIGRLFETVDLSYEFVEEDGAPD